MRKAPGKKYGYIIIPVVVPAEAEAAEVAKSDKAAQEAAVAAKASDNLNRHHGS